MLDATIATLAAHLSRTPQKTLSLTLDLSSWMDSDPRHHSLRSLRFLQLFQHLAPLAILRGINLLLCGHPAELGREEVHALGGALGRSVESLTDLTQNQRRGYTSDQELISDLKAAFPSLLHYLGLGRDAATAWHYQNGCGAP
jgi:hypothetical protein